ncbi:MAG: uridine kinase [Bacilli bacterium]|jgi:uridine kinase|nr:uridine kinase [Bacilli bacterium]
MIIIGIAGGSASGKSSIANIINDYFNKDYCSYLIKLDDYYKSFDELSLEDKLLINYDHPTSFDISLLINHLIDLKNNKSINQPIYDFVNYVRKSETKLIKEPDIIILEGIYTLYDEQLRNLCDYKIYVDVASDIRLIRRIKRDIKKRNRSLENILNQYQTSVRVMYHDYIEPTKKYADIIIEQGKENKEMINLALKNISTILNNNMI